jgi:hypothetical protein
MNKPVKTTRWMSLGIVSLLLLLTYVQHLPFSNASTGWTATVALPPTSDSATCFHNINRAIAQHSPIGASTLAQLLNVAESSAKYESFAQASGATPSLVSTDPAMEYDASAGCAGINVQAYTFSFVSGGNELSIAVDPSTMAVVRALTVPAVTWGGVNESSNSLSIAWGGGYGYWNGSTQMNPSYPYWYIEGDFSLPTASRTSAGCSTTCVYGIWSGLTDYYDGEHIAQTGEGAEVPSSGSTTYYLWYEFYNVQSPNDCTFTVYTGDNLLSASYSSAWASSGGSTVTYNEDTYDSHVGQGCATSSAYYFAGLYSNSYYALLMGEDAQGNLANFGSVTITGTIYDNVYNGGPSGHCTSTPYNDGWWESFHYTSGSYHATESTDNGHCSFNDDFG